MTFLLLFIVPLVLGFWAQHRVTSTFRRYSEVPSATNATGAEIARAILDRNGLHAVPVHHTPGQLSDHYDPATRSVHLSDAVYGERTVAAGAVAAHEVGHAIQHATAWAPMSIRSAVFPAAMLGSNLWMYLFFGGIIVTMVSGQLGGLGMYLILAAIALYSFAVLFHVVTLPVEFDASRRAKHQLREMQLVSAEQADGTAKVLSAAAMTYVAGALVAITQLVWLVMSFMGGDE
jgi:uncharacterized protein